MIRPLLVLAVLAAPLAAQDLSAVLTNLDVVVSGRCIDEAGTPLEGAAVVLAPLDAVVSSAFPFVRVGDPDTRPRATTDADGRFELRETHEMLFGSVLTARVVVSRAGRASTAVSLEVPEHGFVDAGTIVLPPGHAVVVVAEDPDRRPLITARLAVHRDPTQRTFFDEPPYLEAHADARGRCELAGLEAGAHVLELSAVGASSRLLSVEIGPGLAVVDLGTRTLLPGGTLRGLVLTHDGRPVAGARVAAWRPEEFPEGTPWWRRLTGPELGRAGWDETTSDAEGAFAFHGLPTHELEVLAWKEGWQPVRIEGVRATGQAMELRLPEPAELVLAFFDAETGGSVPDVVPIVDRLVPSGGRKAPLAWRLPVARVDRLTHVLEARGRPPAEPDDWIVMPAGPRGHRVRATAPGYVKVDLEVGGVEAGGRLLEKVVMQRGGVLEAEVVDEHHRPLEDFDVSLDLRTDGTGHRSIDVEASGFTASELIGGRWRVTVDAPGFRKRVVDADVIAGETNTLDPIVLVHTPEVVGRVRFPSGDRFALDERVLVWSDAGPWIETDMDWSNTFEVRAPARGPATVYVTTSKGAARPTRIDIGDGTTRVDLALGAASLRGAVRRASDGTPSRGVAVHALALDVDEEARSWASPPVGWTDEHGRYTIPGVPPGRYALRVYEQGDTRTWTATDDAVIVTVPEGERPVTLEQDLVRSHD